MVIFVQSSVRAQELDGWNVSAGITGEVSFNNKGASFFSLALTLGVERELFWNHVEKEEGSSNFFDDAKFFIRDHIRPGYQIALGIYSNGLGDNILDTYKDFNIDFQHSFIVTLGLHDQSEKLEYHTMTHTTTNNTVRGAIYDPFKWSLSFGSTFIVNNNRRNQRIGFANLNLGRYVRFGYYNDGPPYSWISFGDARDRWWTGGAFVEVYFTNGTYENKLFLLDSKVGYYYDRFTGNVQQAYEVSNVLGFNYVPSKDVEQNFYNVGRAKCAWHSFNGSFDISRQTIGHLKYDPQDKIHDIGNWAHHLSFAQSYTVWAAQYDSVREIK